MKPPMPVVKCDLDKYNIIYLECSSPCVNMIKKKDALIMKV